MRKDYSTQAEVRQLQQRVKAAFMELDKLGYVREVSVAKLAGVAERRVWSLLFGAGIECRRARDARGTFLVHKT